MKHMLPILLILLLILTGCDSYDKNTASSGGGIDYNNTKDLRSAIYEICFANDFVDMSVGKENEWENSLSGGYNTNESLFDLYLYPDSDADYIVSTATALYEIDRLFANNKSYKKYCRKNGIPYHIDYYCIEEPLGSLELTGENTLENITDVLTKAIDDCSDTAMAPLYEFYDKLLSTDELYEGDNGTYTFILDTQNFDESSASILKKISEVKAIDPLPESVSKNYRNSQSILGYMDKGFSVYADSAAPQNLLFSDNFAANPRYFLLWMFLPVTGLNPNENGEKSVNLGSAPEDISGNYYHTSIMSEEDGSISVSITLSSFENAEYSREAVCTYAVDYLNDLVNLLKTHNIGVIKAAKIYFSYTYSDNRALDFECEVPLDKNITVEELNSIIEKNGKEYNPQDYILPDDCL